MTAHAAVVDTAPLARDQLSGAARTAARVALLVGLGIAVAFAGAGLVLNASPPRVVAGGALVLAVTAGWQLHTYRHQPAVLAALAVGVLTIVYRPVLSGTVSRASGIALAALAGLALIFLPAHLRRAYVMLLAGLWASQLFPARTEEYEWGVVGNHLLLASLQLGLFMATVIVIRRVDGHVQDQSERYRLLYERVPVAIWDEDFSEVGAWLEELKSGGVADLRSHLDANPQLVDHAMTLIRVRDANPAAHTMLALEEGSELSERIDPTTTTDGTRQSFIDQLAAIWDGQDRITTEVVGRNMKGERLDGILHWAVPRGPDGLDLRHAVVAIDDVTKAKAAIRAKSEFLANMSHELRTPLNAILGMTELSLGTRPTSEQREYLVTIKSAVEALTTLVNDVLDVAKIEEGKLQLASIPYSLRDVVGETVATLLPAAAQKRLTLDAEFASDVPDGVVGDPGRLRQILYNVVGNAIKFTHVGYVRVEVGVDDLSGREVVLHVKVTDSGIGIRREDHEKIFGGFEQADASSTRRYGGAGLGLTITRQLLAAMGGTIWVDSRPGEGSTFHITMRQEIGDLEDVETLVRAPELSGNSVLVLSERASKRKLLEGMLRHAGFVPIAVASIDDAARVREQLQQAEAEICAIVIDDSRDMGAAVCDIAASEALRGLPVILNPCTGTRGDGATYSDLDIAAYLPDPLDQRDLVEAIEVAAAASRAGTALPLITRHWLRERRQGYRLLVVDDSPTNRLVAIRILEKRGHSAVAVENGVRALEALNVENFDLVLMDVQMPEMDGLEATAAIREREIMTGKRIPIVALTAHVREEDRERCFEAGMDAYVAKPFNADELYAVVEQLVSSRIAADDPQPDSERVETSLEHSAQEDLEFMAPIFELFLDGYEELRSDLESAIDAGLLEKAAARAHRLKGELGALGATRAFEAAAHLERAARDGSAGEVEACWAAFRVEMGNVLPSLREAVESMRDVVSEGPSGATLLGATGTEGRVQ